MKKSFVRRAVALSMIGVMMLSGAATGCGKKKVDYNIDDENGGSENGGSGDSGELRAKVKAPESYTGDIPVGNSGLSSIKINAEKIEIPNASTMSVVYCEPLSYDSDYKKTLAESFLTRVKEYISTIMKSRSGKMSRRSWMYIRQCLMMQMQQATRRMPSGSVIP